MTRHLVALVFTALIVGAGIASGQEKGQLGLAMGFPASVGVIYHATETVAIRPEGTFSTTSSTATGSAGTAASSDSNSIGVGIGALFYAAKWESLRAYLSPRFVYSRNSVDSASLAGGVSTSSRSSTYGVSGSFGSQHSLGRRFAVYGEVGIAYAHQTSEASSNAVTNPSTSNSGNSWSTRTAIGGIFYLK